MDGVPDDEPCPPKKTLRYAVKSQTLPEPVEDSILTFVLQDEHKNTLTCVAGLSKFALCEKSPVISALLCGGFAEATQQTIVLKLPEELSPIPEHISAWGKFWQILTNAISVSETLKTSTDNELFAMAIMADMYSIPLLSTAMVELFGTGTIIVNPTTLYVANILNCVEKLICPPMAIAPNNDEIPKILCESIDIDDAFLLMRLWSTHQIAQGENGLTSSPFLDITDATWPAAAGISITTNPNEILDKILELSQLSLGESPEDLIDFLTTHPRMSIAGGSILHAVSTHETRGKGATDIDIWVHEASDDSSLGAVIEYISHSRNMLIGNNNSVMTIMGSGLAKQIQLIHTDAYDVREVMTNFDMPAVQVGLQWNPAKSAMCLYCTVDFLDAMRTGKTSWWNMSTTRPARMRKYVERGFSVPPEYEKFVPGPHDKSVILSELKGFTFTENPTSEHEKARLEITAGLMNPLFTDVRYVTSYAEYHTIAGEHITHWIKHPLGKLSSDYNMPERLRMLPNNMRIASFPSCKLNTGFCSKWYIRNSPDEPDEYCGKLRITIEPDNESLINEMKHIFKHDEYIFKTLEADIRNTLRTYRNLSSEDLAGEMHGDFIHGDRSIRVKATKNCKIIDASTGLIRQKLTFEDTKRPIRVEGFVSIILTHTIIANLCATKIILGPREMDTL